MPANVYLCGPPGAGKSTVAPRLAALRGLRAVDVDRVVEERAGTTIAELVERDGEPVFRAYEREAIARLAQDDACVVSLGGGALEDERNREAIASSGTLVFLDASLATCETRTAPGRARRPLLREDGALARLHAARLPRYGTADVRVAVDDQTPDSLARAIDAALNRRRVVHVATAQPYDVTIGPRVVHELPNVAAPKPGGTVVVVADARLRTLAASVVRAYVSTGTPVRLIEVVAEEELKSLSALGDLYARFVDAKLDRRGIVVGVGGGTIGDAVGFAAATFARGVPFVAVPTTLLAAVDAAIGGKTALNLPAGKNLVGTVTQPAHVAIAPQALRSLDARDVLSGYGEMLKYGLALDAELYRALREGEAALLADPAEALDAIARCVELKAGIVARDEHDVTGVRAVLNFGHTVGHALERTLGYGALRHGEAVIVGMRAALALSVARGMLGDGVRREADDHLRSLPVSDAWREASLDAVAEATQRDKKRAAKGTQFVLLDAIGSARLDDDVSAAELRQALTSIGLGAGA